MKPFRIITVILVLLLTSQAIFAGRYYDSATGRFISVDPHAGNYPGWTPYNYAACNPINIIDPNGLDWYNNTETGALHWYDGTYEDGNIPEGYERLGGDDYFGDTENMISEMRGLLKEQGLNSLDLTVEQSEALAGSFGFKCVPTQNFVFDTNTLNSYPSSGQYGLTTNTEIMTMRSIVNEAYTYVPDTYIPGNFESKGPGGVVQTNMPIEYQFYMRNKINWVHANWATRLGLKIMTLPVIGTWGNPETLPSALNQNIMVETTYKNWKEYPKDGILRKYK